MGVIDKLRRYFVSNPAPVLMIKRTKLQSSFVWTPCGNANGFYWGNWQVIWRRPYADCWGFDGKRWDANYVPATPKDTPHE